MDYTVLVMKNKDDVWFFIIRENGRRKKMLTD